MSQPTFGERGAVKNITIELSTGTSYEDIAKTIAFYFDEDSIL
jgi:hypothetical protein